jgi:hypothetical protein
MAPQPDAIVGGEFVDEVEVELHPAGIFGPRVP